MQGSIDIVYTLTRKFQHDITLCRWAGIARELLLCMCIPMNSPIMTTASRTQAIAWEGSRLFRAKATTMSTLDESAVLLVRCKGIVDFHSLRNEC